jgi:hypothetical protein
LSVKRTKRMLTRSTLAVLILAGFLPAQIKIDATTPEGQTVMRVFDESFPKADATSLACRVQAIFPRMGMSFRLFSGFQATLELAQIPARESRVVVMMRVRQKSKTPQPPVYFWDGLLIPEAAKRPQRPTAFLSGGFYLGPGQYEVDWLMSDDQQRLCRSHWVLDTKKARAPEGALKAGMIEALGLESWRGTEPKTTGPTATIFLNAAPLWRNRYFTRLSSWDRSLLLGSLTAVLDLGGFRSVRVVAYDMLGRRVLFEDNLFARPGYTKLAQALREANFGVVDYGVLKDGPTEGTFLAQLIADDRKAAKPTDITIFLGPELRGTRRLPEEMEKLTEQMPRTVYLALAREPVSQGDVISKLVKAVKGKMYLVQRGPDLLKPLKALAENKVN